MKKNFQTFLFAIKTLKIWLSTKKDKKSLSLFPILYMAFLQKISELIFFFVRGINFFLILNIYFNSYYFLKKIKLSEFLSFVKNLKS